MSGFTYRPTTRNTIQVWRDDLPAVADVDAYAVELDEKDLTHMLGQVQQWNRARADELGLNDDRTGGL